ncbi:MAG: VWA domain-containing protein [Roseivirga sp.]|nr:VWA domain-containing protein [Roseivirga sp.]
MKNLKALSILSLCIIVSCSYEGRFPRSSSGFIETYAPEGLAGGDQYTELEENRYFKTEDHPVSTFSTDADGASYANMRRFVTKDEMIPYKGAIRTEEFINYFNLDYPVVQNEHPISLNGEVSQCPWNTDHKLLRVGIKGKPIPEGELPNSNFVFLIDVSGSMADEDKLTMLKSGFKLFVDQMREDDRVAIVTYAGEDKLHLESTSGKEKDKIKKAIQSLGWGGSTAGAAGITTAYEIARENFIEGGNNRIILGTDGDFNVGIWDKDELIKLIEEKRETGIFLTVLGVGRGNLNDAALEQIANHGNGTYEYIDHIEQLRKVFLYDFQKFYAVAKDVKVQIEFNPENVLSYRLIGYENRVLATEDFKDDKKDAGEIGANQNVTALYEIVPTGNNEFRTTPTFTVNFRYKRPDSDESVPMSLGVYDQGKVFDDASGFMKFTAGVASFSLLLTDSEYKGYTSYKKVLKWVSQARLTDPNGFKEELFELIKAAEDLPKARSSE